MTDLETRISGISFPNPIWTAAGPGGASAEKLLEAAAGGAGGLVAKTISVTPARVPIPNIASPFPGSLLNAELWSEIPYRQFIEKDLAAAKTAGIPLIASVGYTPKDLRILGKALQKSGVADAVEFSVHYIGKDIKNLQRTARALRNSVDMPILMKFSPAVGDLPAVIRGVEELVDGFVAINSLGPALDFNIHTLQPHLGSSDGRGWLSGRAILPIGLHFVETIASLSKKPVIGVGGIRTVTDILKYLMAGASAVQVCSLAVLSGQSVYGKLAGELAHWMEKNGYPSIEELRGAFGRREKTPAYFFQEGPQLYPAIQYSECKFCDFCVRACMYGAISFHEKKYFLQKEKCVSCGLCTTVCPYDALHMVNE